MTFAEAIAIAYLGIGTGFLMGAALALQTVAKTRVSLADVFVAMTWPFWAVILWTTIEPEE